MYLKGKRSCILCRMAAVFLTAALFAAITLVIPEDLEAAENGSSASVGSQAQNGNASETAVYTVGNTKYTYSTSYDGKATVACITDCGTTDTEIDIPGEINGLKVTGIGFEAFKGCSSLVSVTIPEGVTSIGLEAFRECSGLTSVTIPSSVTKIGGLAFYKCSGLNSVTISEGVTSIGFHAFELCGALTSVTIPSSVTSIEEYPFGDCKNLMQINVAADNKNYKDIDGILFNKTGTKLVEYPSGRKGAYTISEDMESIDKGAFYGCRSLTSITIPEGVSSIGDRAFTCCVKLTSITIPSSVTSIGEDLFTLTPGLTEIKVAADNKNYKDIDGVLFNKSGTELIQYPSARKGMYTIPEGVISINDYAFSPCIYLTSITIPSSVTVIGNGAFYYCSGLTAIEIPESVTSVGGLAFMACSGLMSVTLPSGIKEIGNQAFGYLYYDGSKIDNFTIYGQKGTAAESYAAKNGFAFVETAYKSDSSTNIAIQYPKDAIENDELIKLITKGIAENGDEYEEIKDKLNAENAGNVKFAAFDIKLQDNNGNSVRPRGQITVKIPVPAGISGSKCRVYYMDGNGKFTDMNATYSNGFVVFSTNHFSMYIVTEAQISSSGSGDNSDGSGDASDDNGDNESSEVSGSNGDGRTSNEGNNTLSGSSATNAAETPDNGNIEAPSEAANGENSETPSEAVSGNEEAEETSDDSDSPKTGDMPGKSMALFMMCIVSAGAAALAVRGKKA